jgi:hypothetical protein
LDELDAVSVSIGSLTILFQNLHSTYDTRERINKTEDELKEHKSSTFGGLFQETVSKFYFSDQIKPQNLVVHGASSGIWTDLKNRKLHLMYIVI